MGPRISDDLYTNMTPSKAETIVTLDAISMWYHQSTVLTIRLNVVELYQICIETYTRTYVSTARRQACTPMQVRHDGIKRGGVGYIDIDPTVTRKHNIDNYNINTPTPKIYRPNENIPPNHKFD